MAVLHFSLERAQGNQLFSLWNSQTVSESLARSNSGQGTFGWQTLAIPVGFGDTISISLWGDTGVGGGSSGVASFGSIANFSHTMGWGGIESLTDQDGNAITGFSAMSVDGSFNYVNSALEVPEPGLMLMFATGLLTIGVVGRRRKS